MIDWSSLVPVAREWAPALLQGIWISMKIAVGSFLAGLVIGALVAWAKLRGGVVTQWLANRYTTVCRSVPELLLILLLFYAGGDLVNRLAQFLGYDGYELDGMLAAIVVLGVVQGAYIGEVLRGAVLAIPVGQIEAARALGMRPTLYARRILLPGLVPFALGGLSNLWLVLIKDTALISVVGYSELLYTAKQAASGTKHYFLFYLLAGVVYLVITIVSGVIVGRVQKRVNRWMPSLH